jgi:hypothetical protein
MMATLGALNFPRPITIDKLPARSALEIVPSLERLHAADDGSSVDERITQTGHSSGGGAGSGVDVICAVRRVRFVGLSGWYVVRSIRLTQFVLGTKPILHVASRLSATIFV